ncbi:hypothetical protein ACF5DM_004537 [Salmonella enterica]
MKDTPGLSATYAAAVKRFLLLQRMMQSPRRGGANYVRASLAQGVAGFDTSDTSE